MFISFFEYIVYYTIDRLLLQNFHFARAESIAAGGDSKIVVMFSKGTNDVKITTGIARLRAMAEKRCYCSGGLIKYVYVHYLGDATYASGNDVGLIFVKQMVPIMVVIAKNITLQPKGM